MLFQTFLLPGTIKYKGARIQAMTQTNTRFCCLTFFFFSFLISLVLLERKMEGSEIPLLG